MVSIQKNGVRFISISFDFNYFDIDVPNSHPLAHRIPGHPPYRGCKLQRVLPLKNMKPAVTSVRAASQDRWTRANFHIHELTDAHALINGEKINTTPPHQDSWVNYALLDYRLWHCPNSNFRQSSQGFSVAPLRSLDVSFLSKLLRWGSFH